MIVYILLFVTALFGSNRDLNDSDKKIIPQHLSLDWSFFTKALSQSTPEILKTLYQSLPNQLSHANNKNDEIVPDKKELPGLPLEVWKLIFGYLNQNIFYLGSINCGGSTVPKMNFGHLNQNAFSLVCTTFQDILNRATQYVKLRERSNPIDIPCFLGCFSYIKRIKLPTDPFESHANSIMSHLSILTNIQELDLSFCTKVTDKGFAHLSQLINLQKIKLDNVWDITDSTLACLSLLTNIRELSLNGCEKITDAGLSHLSGLTNIQELDLTFCKKVTDKGFTYLSQLINLQNINLKSVSQITDKGLSHLSGLTNLKHLNIQYCAKVTQRGWEELKKKIPHLNIRPY